MFRIRKEERETYAKEYEKELARAKSKQLIRKHEAIKEKARRRARTRTMPKTERIKRTGLKIGQGARKAYKGYLQLEQTYRDPELILISKQEKQSMGITEPSRRKRKKTGPQVLVIKTQGQTTQRKKKRRTNDLSDPNFWF